MGRWWNGAWGRLARRDVELWTGQMWRVVMREGGTGGSERSHWFVSEDEARTFVRRCLAGARGWREPDS